MTSRLVCIFLLGLSVALLVELTVCTDVGDENVEETAVIQRLPRSPAKKLVRKPATTRRRNVAVNSRNKNAGKGSGFKVSKKCRCGVKSSNVNQRIVNGKDAQKHEYPWQALLLRDCASVFCGGSLINDRYILTAAHCVKKITEDDLCIVLGAHDGYTDTKESTTVRQVTKIIVHPGYVDREHDIALLKLNKPVPFDKRHRPVCLPTKKAKFEGKPVTVSGWGATSEGGSTSAVLQKVELKVISNDQCDSMYSKAGIPITDCMICAYGNRKDSCQGDSGGPLVHRQGKKNHYVQCGVVSFGVGCAREGFPGVYANVPYYIKWILSNSKDGIFCAGGCVK